MELCMLLTVQFKQVELEKQFILLFDVHFIQDVAAKNVHDCETIIKITGLQHCIQAWNTL